MTYIENIFLCLALPMLLSLLFISGSPRRFTLFVVLGMATCLLSVIVIFSMIRSPSIISCR